MIKSMTGFGKSTAEISNKKISIEIRSLNSRSLDINTRIPVIYREKEAEIRNLISQKLDRGKIDFSITVDVIGADISSSINKPVVKNYFIQLREIADELGINADDQMLNTIMRLPEALKTEKTEPDEEEWEALKIKTGEALDQLDSYRIEEGRSLEADMVSCTRKIMAYLEEIKNFEGERITRIREKFSSVLTEFQGNSNIDMNRFEQELIYYLEKLDINEEKVRLRKHCEYFLEKIESPAPNGKILNFISQEMGREINTIGSKANDASIQKLVVMMKDDLEKIKEQSLNVL
ncbi:MAG TPA: YicC family protein [Bacteroidales bacterium]|nr:YicC family protein [Bacteroidales bacterium]HPF02196.1 YicC family protein [Bacteroidales bacterium]HPJ59257.1 YicC family protein [Bacteroidales bacterium]HPR11065.1 YicC family protein [Bacteroidales bacterium]HRW84408.1 YicC family protein [Bacteroidales bacterium]